ncbi:MULTISPECIES: hypothetical protein [unclassified Gordonia (in: high G+C Gram-positive bacteria)]|uniref:hypothetical protein n=1 Tax=unclassified Gordonia (in: high G+C Gram-positive bacteria) TaxID=2657482 RepID=UPI0019661B4C|nr:MULTISPECIES: hypothetical protein [unclassified Gordonia (in: high G+C Gram-positive bacteria)]MBN0975376.1 hypothetical protein [Gordonia sp. BP-119]MBN0985541.1 hypothetical protein [Gordonia sp. BP-94]
MTSTAPTYQGLSQDQLAVLVPELLLSGQMIDRSGMAHLISAFGRDVMGKVAIEEWMAASPVYTHRMRTALGIEGDGVEDMFKCLQLDIGAPPQFMDFRYRIDDEYHGSFVLDHCGALLDVEPLGDDYVTTMCHDIEDPTFDATAIATNRRARIRPVHRPPRRPVDRTPHCEWTVTIEPDRDELPLPPDSVDMFETRAGQLVLSAIDTTETDGWVDYRGPLVEDLQFAEWSTSALVRVAEEVALQHQLLSLGFLVSLRRYAESEAQTTEIFRKQLIGIAGLAADRIRVALDLSADAAGLAQVLALHPCFGPTQYTGLTAEADGDTVTVRIPRESDAMTDGGWTSILDADHVEPMQAAATAVDPYLVVADATEADGDLVVRITKADTPQKEYGEVAVARFSGGASFEFVDRGRSIPITPVGSSA